MSERPLREILFTSSPVAYTTRGAMEEGCGRKEWARADIKHIGDHPRKRLPNPSNGYPRKLTPFGRLVSTPEPQSANVPSPAVRRNDAAHLTFSPSMDAEKERGFRMSERLLGLTM